MMTKIVDNKIQYLFYISKSIRNLSSCEKNATKF